MRIIRAGVSENVPDDYAMRLIEQGMAKPDKTAFAKKPRKRSKDVKKHEPEREN